MYLNTEIVNCRGRGNNLIVPVCRFWIPGSPDVFYEVSFVCQCMRSSVSFLSKKRFSCNPLFNLLRY